MSDDDPDDPTKAELSAHVASERKRLEHGNRLFVANREQYEMADANLAALYFIRFAALKNAGFTDHQAMQIVLTFGIED
jgi:hypothetical protein